MIIMLVSKEKLHCWVTVVFVKYTQLPTMTERMIICRKFGAQVHFTAAAKGVPGMQVHMDNLLASNPDYWNPKQERR